MRHIRWKLLFDGECETCTAFARHVGKFDRDGQIDVISLQDHFKNDPTIPLESLQKEVHLVGDDGQVLKGGEAIQMILLLAPRLKPFRWMIESRWGTKSAGIIYRSMKKFHRCRRCGN